jgi:hypothetical protein
MTIAGVRDAPPQNEMAAGKLPAAVPGKNNGLVMNPSPGLTKILADMTRCIESKMTVPLGKTLVMLPDRSHPNGGCA